MVAAGGVHGQEAAAGQNRAGAVCGGAPDRQWQLPHTVATVETDVERLNKKTLQH